MADRAERCGVGANEFECAGPSFFADPYATYAQVRAAGLGFDPAGGGYLIGRYADVEAVLRDARLSKHVRRATPTAFETAVLFRDPPDHARIRGVMNQAFSTEMMSGLEDHVRRIADRLIDQMREQGEVDFMTVFARTLPVLVIAHLMGVPAEDAERLHRLSGDFLIEDAAPPEDVQRRQHTAITEMAAYFERVIDRRGLRHQRDVIGVLAQAHETERLSRDELIGNCILLMVAGHETTVNLLGNGLHLLLRHPEQLAVARAQPALWPLAIEEVLRFESPVQFGTFRVSTEAIEIAGGRIERGSIVTALIGSANRDPEQFPAPDRFDITRAPNRHLAFGAGPHRCVGASLARVEALVGFSRLFERRPNLRLAAEPARGWIEAARQAVGLRRQAPPAPCWRSHAITRGLRELIVSC